MDISSAPLQEIPQNRKLKTTSESSNYPESHPTRSKIEDAKKKTSNGLDKQFRSLSAK